MGTHVHELFLNRASEEFRLAQNEEEKADRYPLMLAARDRLFFKVLKEKQLGLCHVTHTRYLRTDQSLGILRLTDPKITFITNWDQEMVHNMGGEQQLPVPVRAICESHTPNLNKNATKIIYEKGMYMLLSGSLTLTLDQLPAFVPPHAYDHFNIPNLPPYRTPEEYERLSVKAA